MEQSSSVNKISSFGGLFRFLSNFHPAPLLYKGIMYPTSEHAYVSAKTLNENTKLNVAMLATPGEAKKYGRSIKLRPDWNDVKLAIMEEIVREKFIQNPPLLEKLLATEDIYLEEGNTWGDTFWGVCDGEGQNHLGKILMKIRTDLNTYTKETQ